MKRPARRRRFCHVAIAATPPRLSLQASGSSNGWAPPRGSIRRTAVVLADDRFDRGDGPEPACAWATKESLIAPHGTRRGGCLPTIGVTTAIHHPAGDSSAGGTCREHRTRLGLSWLVSRSVTVRRGGRSAGAGHARRWQIGNCQIGASLHAVLASMRRCRWGGRCISPEDWCARRRSVAGRRRSPSELVVPDHAAARGVGAVLSRPRCWAIDRRAAARRRRVRREHAGCAASLTRAGSSTCCRSTPRRRSSRPGAVVRRP